MDDELLELVPVFVAEARERLQRLADLVPGLGRDSDSLVEIKRELHTLKGSRPHDGDRAFRRALPCHRGGRALPSSRISSGCCSPLDALAAMVEAVEGGEPVQAPSDLLSEFERACATVGVAAEPRRSRPQPRARRR